MTDGGGRGQARGWRSGAIRTTGGLAASADTGSISGELPPPACRQQDDGWGDAKGLTESALCGLLCPRGPLAQLVEQLTLNQRVEGSSPSRSSPPSMASPVARRGFFLFGHPDVAGVQGPGRLIGRGGKRLARGLAGVGAGERWAAGIQRVGLALTGAYAFRGKGEPADCPVVAVEKASGSAASPFSTALGSVAKAKKGVAHGPNGRWRRVLSRRTAARAAG